MLDALIDPQVHTLIGQKVAPRAGISVLHGGTLVVAHRSEALTVLE